MKDETVDITQRVGGGLRDAWQPLLLVHVLYTVLGVTILAPATALLVRSLVALSGGAVVADQQIVEFLLRPVGLVAFVIIASVLITVLALEQAALMAVGFAQLQGWHLTAWEAIGFATRRAGRILALAARIVVTALVIAAPFLAAAAAVYWWLLTDFDINYYLAARPREFWIGAVLIGLLLLVMSVLLLRRLTSWALAMPLLLFQPAWPRDALALSEQHTQGRRWAVCRWWLVWAAVVVVSGAAGVLLLDALGEWLMPTTAASLPRVLATVVILLVPAAVAGVILAAGQAATFALLEVALFDRWLPLVRETAPQVGTVARGEAIPIHTRRIIGWGLVGASGLAVAAGFALIDSVQPEDHVEIIAHRGAAGRAPENTLASIRAAIEDGTDWVEIDVQETADGQIVVVHDSDFMKLAGVDLKVWNGTVDEIRAIDVGRWFGASFAGERVPTLAEVLDEARGRARVVIELKYYGHDRQLEQRVAEHVEAAGMQDDVAIMSLDYRGVQKFRALRPDWPAGVLMARGVGRMSDLDVDFLAVNAGMATRRLIRSAHAAGRKVYVWTINDAAQMSGMISLGVDALITDEPALVRRVLADRAKLNFAERLMIQAADRFEWLPAPPEYRDDSP